MKTPILETKRLTLKPVTMDDAPAIQKYFNNWNIVQNLSMAVPWPYPDDGAESFLRDIALPKVEKGESHIWAIFTKDAPNEAIGIVDYRAEADIEGNRGFWLAEPFWGKGYMTEAVGAVQDFLFFELGIEKLLVTNAKSNAASRRIKEKTGAVFIGEVVMEHRSGDREMEQWLVTSESWQASRNKNV